MSDITEFLLARITEDEEAARAAFSNQADPENGWGTDGRAVAPHVGVIHEDVQRAHVAKWHPGRVLAECEAKRQIIAEYDGLTFEQRSVFDHWYRSVMRNVLHHVAQPYADHPDYRQEWDA